MNNSLLSTLRKAWGIASSTDQLYFCPGRVNIIGEHIDYNGGLVFPAALCQGIYALVRPRDERRLRFRSIDRPEAEEVLLTELLQYQDRRGWLNYPLGVAAILQSQGCALRGADILLGSDLPIGSGISSSAAMEVLTGFILLSLSSSADIDRVKLSLLAQKAEREFVGVNCGIMDQFSVALGKAGHAILLDCATLDYQYVPLALGDYELVVMNTKKARDLAASKYNERRSECETALRLIAAEREIKNLCEATPEEVAKIAAPIIRKRARHVISEQQRVHDSVAALHAGDLAALGKLLDASHRSLKQDYEVTGDALDAIVGAAQSFPGCLGARMTGAGFGGCAIALVPRTKGAEFESFVARSYHDKTGIEAEFIHSDIGEGVRRLYI